MVNFKVLRHASVVLDDDIYFDPYKIDGNLKKARYIFITHPHYDHLSMDDINKIACDKTVFIATSDSKNILLENNIKNKIIEVKPKQMYDLGDISFQTFSSYNANKPYHKKDYGWVGFNVEIDDENYMITGDCDECQEMLNQKCEYLFVPIGSIYTFDGKEGALFANKLKPKVAIPTHYNCIVGDKTNEREFLQYLDKSIKYEIFL